MKKIAGLIVLVIGLAACNNASKNQQNGGLDSINNTAVVDTFTSSSNSSKKAFDIKNVPISNSELGEFPFFTAPEGAEYINRVKPIEFDFIVFVTPENVFEVEGETFRAYVHPDKKSDKEIGFRYLLKSYEDAIEQAGGVKVFEGMLKGDRLEKYKELASYAGSNGSIDVYNNEIITYVIRHQDGDVYIAIDKTGYRTTSIQIVREKPFKQTIKTIQAEAIKKQLADQGKAILHINFDTDKATLKPDGSDVVAEIVKVLKDDSTLKISINGYTDNIGDIGHNQKLSESRASTVKDEIIKAGIDKSRLTSKGFGQADPIADNRNEDGRSQNRRVELVKQ